MTDGVEDARASFDARVDALPGRRVLAVDYWEMRNYGPTPADWDYGDWHHAVMGVQLTTDNGPVTVTWTATFYPYGVEVFLAPISDHLHLHDDGPQRVGPHGESRWDALVASPIRDATTWWERLDIGPTRRMSDGEIVSPAFSVDVPVALRLDFDAGPVWFVPGIPQFPDMEKVFIPGDEIVVVFTGSKMRQIGFTDPEFTG